MATSAIPELLIGASILMGLVISVVEIGFVHADEAGMHWLTHALHAVPFTLLFVFLEMNTSWALSLVGLHSNTLIVLGAQVLIGIIAMVKIGAAASITGHGGVGEKKIHILIIGVLIIATSYIWKYVLAGVLGQYLPF